MTVQVTICEHCLPVDGDSARNFPPDSQLYSLPGHQDNRYTSIVHLYLHLHLHLHLQLHLPMHLCLHLQLPLFMHHVPVVES